MILCYRYCDISIISIIVTNIAQICALLQLNVIRRFREQFGDASLDHTDLFIGEDNDLACVILTREYNWFVVKL